MRTYGFNTNVWEKLPSVCFRSGAAEEMLCVVLSEYSRACAHADHPLHDWRRAFPLCGTLDLCHCHVFILYNKCDFYMTVKATLWGWECGKTEHKWNKDKILVTLRDPLQSTKLSLFHFGHEQKASSCLFKKPGCLMSFNKQWLSLDLTKSW